MTAMERIRKLWEDISAVVLMLVAVLGFAYEVVQRFGPKQLLIANPEEVLIFLVATLCGGLGAEKFLTLRRMGASIEEGSKQRKAILNAITRISKKLGKLQSEVTEDFLEVESGLSEIGKTETLIGTQAIEAAAIGMIDTSDKNANISATSQYSTTDVLSKRYLEAIASKVKRSAEDEGDMEYHLVGPVRANSESEPEDERTRVFTEKDILGRLKLKRARQSWPMEVLIVGHSMIIALRGGRKRPAYEVAIRITDREFVEKASNWYMEAVWAEAEAEEASKRGR